MLIDNKAFHFSFTFANSKNQKWSNLSHEYRKLYTKMINENSGSSSSEVFEDATQDEIIHEEQEPYSDAAMTEIRETRIPPPPEIFQAATSTLDEDSPLPENTTCPIIKGTDQCKHPGKSSLCSHSLYGSPLPVNVLKETFPRGQTEGLVWNIRLVPNDYDAKYPRKLKVLDKKDYDPVHRCIKPRRGIPAVKADDFFSSLVRIDDEDDDLKPPRWIFSGILNGWPAFHSLELLRIEFMGALPRWHVYWTSESEAYSQDAEGFKDVDFPVASFRCLDPCAGNSVVTCTATTTTDNTVSINTQKRPSYPVRSPLHIISDCRAIVRMPPYTSKGYSKESPGHVWWFEVNRKVPRILYGTNILREFEKDRLEESRKAQGVTLVKSSPRCIQVHMISHRYSPGEKSEESLKDLLVYHSIALLEWDHKQYCTVVEAAWLNGIGGFNGKSNWIPDKNESITTLLKTLPPEMIAPWKTTFMEIRAYDVLSKNLNEFLDFMKLHTGKNHRFLDVNVSFSHLVRLSFCTKEHIAQYLINYISRGKTYSEIRANCQTFVADFCGFLAGKKDVLPFHPLNRIEYRNHSHFFLYDSSLYF